MGELHTIAALATAPAPAGLAVIRVSGPETRRALQVLFRAKRSPSEHPREMIYGSLINYKTGKPIDSSMAVFFPGPNSYTGEDICEFQMHGSILLVQKVLRSLYAFGISPAEPGEFTRRAFLNGKCDLTQAEAIADLISATSQEALKIAGEQLKGRFSEALTDLGEPLRDDLAELEAAIDFPDEDIKPESLEKIRSDLMATRRKITEYLESYNYGQVVKEGFRVLLCGRPNAGKSSLLNLLLGMKRAIVTPIAGTTRDLIEEAAVISGYRFVFCDSAGITETDNEVEKIGIELAQSRVEWADLVLLVVDSTEEPIGGVVAWRSVLKEIKGRAKRIWLVVNKIDLTPNAVVKFAPEASSVNQIFYLSVKSKEGLPYLKEALADEISKRLPDTAQTATVVTNERQRDCLIKADEGLSRAVEAIKNQLPTEIVSSELRLSLSALDEIVGKTWNEDILGRIFARFCIGK